MGITVYDGPRLSSLISDEFPFFSNLSHPEPLGCSPNRIEVSGCPLSGKVEDLFRTLTDSTRISQISASGCNLTGTLTDPSSFRQRGFRR